MSRGSSRRLEVFCEKALLWTDDDYLGPLHVETATGDELDRVGASRCGRALRRCPRRSRCRSSQYAVPTKAFLDGLAGGATAPGWPDAATALTAHRARGRRVPLRGRRRGPDAA